VFFASASGGVFVRLKGLLLSRWQRKSNTMCSLLHATQAEARPVSSAGIDRPHCGVAIMNHLDSRWTGDRGWKVRTHLDQGLDVGLLDFFIKFSNCIGCAHPFWAALQAELKNFRNQWKLRRGLSTGKGGTDENLGSRCQRGKNLNSQKPLQRALKFHD